MLVLISGNITMHTFEDIRRDLHVATLRYQFELLAAADLNEKTRRQALKEANETGGKVFRLSPASK
jgi:hypothetical protein